LGVSEVVAQGRALKFPTQKTLALLIYLAVEGGYHSREKLMALLWPDSDTKHGQASLRNDLHRLRIALSGYTDHILADRELVAFEVGNIQCDWRRLDDALRQPSIPLLQTALDLYRGNFLEGFTLSNAPDYDEWMFAEREHWHRVLSQVLEQLARLQSERGDLSGSLETARRWVIHDPLDEAAHRQLVRVLFATEGKAAALQAYERCRLILSERLITEPSPETMALADHLRNTNASHLVNRVKSPLLTRPYNLPFVGRATEHRALVVAYHRMGEQPVQVITLEGEAGIGKTRLANEFLAWAVAQGSDILHGQAYEAGGSLPYQPLVDALRACLDQENAPEDLLNDVWLSELARLLPELRDRYPDLPSANDDQFTRNRLFETVATLGVALAKRKPIVFFVDDLQWADSASLDMLHYLIRRWRASRSPFLILLSIRGETVPALSEWLANLGREATLDHIGLKPITIKDTHQLIGSVINEQQQERLAQWLFAETKGQPFFLVETINVLFEQGVLKPNAVGLIELVGDIASVKAVIAPGVREVILVRLRQLTVRANSLLMAAATIGRSCCFEWLCQVANLKEDEALSALEVLLGNRFLIEMSDTPRPYSFANDIIRTVVYEAIGEARRRIYHRRVLEVLEAAAAPSAELAHHALLTGLSESAYHYSIAAGDTALAAFAVHEAIEHYEQARTLQGQLVVSDGSHLCLQLGRAYELDGRANNAAPVYQEMLAQVADQPQAKCAALNRLAVLAVHRYDCDTAKLLLQRAVALAEKHNDKAGLIEAELNLAQLTHHRFDFSASLMHSERALALTRDLGQREMIARTLNSLAYAHSLLGQLDRGEPEMREAQHIYVELGNRAMEVDCRTALAAIKIWQGQVDAGIAEARIAHALSQAISNPWGQIYSSNWLAMGLMDRSMYDEALKVAQEAHDIAQTHDFMPVVIFNCLILGNVHRTLMQFDAALEIHREVEAMNVQPGPVLSQIKAELCTDFAFNGDWDSALKYAREALMYRQYHELPLVLSPRWTETEALIRGGDIDAAQQDAVRWGELVSHIPRLRIPHLRSLACLASGQIKKEYLREAAALAESMGLLGELGQNSAALSELEQVK